MAMKESAERQADGHPKTRNAEIRIAVSAETRAARPPAPREGITIQPGQGVRWKQRALKTTDIH